MIFFTALQLSEFLELLCRACPVCCAAPCCCSEKIVEPSSGLLVCPISGTCSERLLTCAEEDAEEGDRDPDKEQREEEFGGERGEWWGHWWE